MKVWKKDRRYKIQNRGNGWWNVWFEDKPIGMACGEEQARVAIYKHNGEKEFVREEDFEEESWGDNEFKYPESIQGENNA